MIDRNERKHYLERELDLDLVMRMARVKNADVGALSPAGIAELETEYRRFLVLASEPGVDTPMLSPLVDEVWHVHLLWSAPYRAMCERLGVHLDHEPVGDVVSKIDDDEVRLFVERYTSTFGEPPSALWSGVSRCRGKPCHSPKPCRCRRR